MNRAKLRSTAEYHKDDASPVVRALAQGLIQALDALEVQPIKDPYRELQAFLDEVRPDKPPPEHSDNCKCWGCTVGR